MVPGLRRTAYKFVGSRGPPPIHQTRELRLGTADLPSTRSPAQPSERDAGGGGPQGRAACGGGLTAILDLRPRRRLAGIMVGTEGWFL